MMPPYSWPTPGRKPGTSTKRQDRDVEGVAEAHEPRRLLGGIDVEAAGQHHRLVGDDADSRAVEADEAAEMFLAWSFLDLEEIALVGRHGMTSRMS
jgi:hypothetical protein